MKQSTRWWTAILFLLALTLSACKTIDLSTLPPIVLVPPVPTTPVVPAAKAKATLAFQVVNVCDGQPIGAAFASVTDGPTKQVNDDGYAAFELEAEGSIYLVAFNADGYASSARRFQVDGNRQFPIRLNPLAGCPTPEPPKEPAPVVVPPPVVTPPVVAPPAVIVPPAFAHCAGAQFDGLSCVKEVAGKYPALLQINTYEACVEFTQRVLEALGPDWGHVSKTSGEGQAVPRGFVPLDVRGSDGNVYHITGVSHDAIKHRLTGQVIDVLGNGSANSDPDVTIHGPAVPQWSEIPPQFWRVNNPFIPAVPVR